MITTNLIFACDESGAKGYADQTESYPGEVGVFAGILVPPEVESRTSLEFQAVVDKHRPSTGKLHIADLPPAQQEALRQDVYTAIRSANLPCFWYAIHVNGLNDWYLTQKKLAENNRQPVLAAQQQPPRIKRNSPRDNPASMHEVLFEGLYAHLVAFLEERNQKEVSIEVRTDQIDSPIVKNFEVAAKRLLSDDPLLKVVKGFDTVTKQVVEGAIEIGITLPPSMQIEAVVRKLTINAVTDGDGYVLAADVLANSLNHLFKQRDKGELYEPLNQPSAIMKHPLAYHLAAFYDWGIGDLVGDRLFSHPKGRGPR
ncbi:hypothetical protein NKI95_11465 [Mesorhizobium sp. M0306]|uniref:hypothetical protein n=1 Tax=Mesorhizobium sp. M0306 TaxID=2956932 RepID=UPI00333AE8DF